MPRDADGCNLEADELEEFPLSDSDLEQINCYAQAVGDAEYLEFYHDNVSIDLALARLMRDLAKGGAK